MGVNNTLILHKRNSYIPHSQLFLIAEKLKNKNFEVGTISYGVLSLVSDFNDISFDRLVQLRNYVMDFIDTTNEILF